MRKHQCLEMIMERWEEPFEIPIMISQDLHDLKATDYAVKVYNLTQSGRISSKGRSHLMLNFCPMCGEQLREVDAPSPSEASANTDERPPGTDERTDGEGG